MLYNYIEKTKGTLGNGSLNMVTMAKTVVYTTSITINDVVR